ncbi:hypothetical protein ILYODFUR_035866 [Ilyodon furcidens]|uniref:Uncharacterized protein n=1 Tax=Ilyodon furcidens TaxID=33524 RepID=A0ABV0T4E1_9TELE
MFSDGAGVSQVCWVTGATDLLIALEEYLSRRLPAIRCQSVCLARQKPELTDHSSLNFGFGSRSFLDNQDYLCLVDFVWISFPSIKLAASCSPSPEPRQKRNLSTLPHEYLNIGLTPELTRTHCPAQVKPSGFHGYAHLGPDSLYPWRPDYTKLSKPFNCQSYLPSP